MFYNATIFSIFSQIRRYSC